MAEYVRRDLVLRCIKESRENIDWGQSEDEDAFLHYSACLYRTIASAECIPAADVVERKTGKWEVDEVGCGICSACGNFAFETTTHHISGWYPRFCPNCGAKMIGGDEDV